MTLLEAIKSRHSVRRYVEKPIDVELVNVLHAKVDKLNEEYDLHIQLITNEPKAFKGKMAYGTFHGVTNYFAMIGSTKSEHTTNLSERIGYCGEQLVLLAQTLGLSTCWVGLTYNNVKEAYSISKDEKLCCMIALGYGDDAGRNMKRKKAEDVSNISDDAPQWFHDGVAAALLAPTAVNQQKFYFEYVAPDKVKAIRRFSFVGYTKMDLGIAKLHFELAAGKDNFTWIEE